MSVTKSIVKVAGAASTLALSAAGLLLGMSVLQRQQEHEERYLHLEEARIHGELTREALQFLRMHSDELGYLPLCPIASCVNRHGKHSRRIYTDFCYSSSELQAEILRQAGIWRMAPEEISVSRIRSCIDALNRDVGKYNLGQPLSAAVAEKLMNGSLCFAKGFSLLNERKFSAHPGVSDPLVTTVSLPQYVDDFFKAFVVDGETRSGLEVEEPTNYIVDTVFDNEIVSSGWMMTLILSLCASLAKYVYHLKGESELLTVDDISSWEDACYRTLYCLLWMYH